MEPELRALLLEHGTPSPLIGPILDEMKGYHLALYGEHSSSITLTLDLSAEQAAAVGGAIDAQFREYNEVVRERMDTAQGIILKLLMQRHGVLPC